MFDERVWAHERKSGVMVDLEQWTVAVRVPRLVFQSPLPRSHRPLDSHGMRSVRPVDEKKRPSPAIYTLKLGLADVVEILPRLKLRFYSHFIVTAKSERSIFTRKSPKGETHAKENYCPTLPPESCFQPS